MGEKVISWQTEKLNNICDIGTGKWDANHATQNGKYKFFTCAKESVYCDTFKFSGECLILPGNGVNVGEVFYYNGDFDAYQRTYVLSNTKVEAKFLHYHLLLYWKERNLSKQFGSATNFIKMENFLNYEISFPSIEEQKRIVGILDEVFDSVVKAKEATEKNLKNAREVFESYLQSVFEGSKNNWKETTLGEAYDTRDGTHDSPKYQEKGFPLITSKNLKQDVLNFDNIKHISSEDYIKINARSKVDKGDVLFAMIGTIGNPVVVEIEPNFAIKNVALFKVPQSQNPYFLKYFLDSKSVIEIMNKEAKGTTQKFVGLNYLREFKIYLPSLTEQKFIIAKLDALSTETKKLEEIYKQKLTHLEELKKSILKKAFNGEL